MMKISAKSGDVEYVYSIHTFGIYKGHKLCVENEKGNQFFLATDNLEALKACDLEWLDRGFYAKWVDKSEVALFEEKTLKPNFFGEND